MGAEENLAKTKKGVRIVNCARGELVDEAGDGERRSKSGHVAGAAFDVFVGRAGGDQYPLFGPAECRLHAASRRRDQ